ncbi:MAG: PIN domain-containing protein [Pseudonocardia sp.]|nr:PIN domain-containing protein [Pseudonocardia sp.]
MQSPVVLDSWAVLTVLYDGPGTDEVEEVLAARPVMSWINLGEVLYVLTRRHGVDRAEEDVRDIRRSVRADLPDEKLVRGAAAIKARYRMSYADAFAAATALAHDAELWTGDPELLVPDAPWRTRDLRT